MLLILFRNRPRLAPDLLRDVLHLELPDYSEVRIESADLTDVQPAEYRADLVVLLYDGRPRLGIVLEVQLSRDENKSYAWPAYATNLRARARCPVYVFVVAPDRTVARWASTPIGLGGESRFVPFALDPSGVPQVTDPAQARAAPELAVLSAMAHGGEPDIDTAASIADAAVLASAGLDHERSRLYLDLVMSSLTEAARRALKTMDPAKYEYQSEFARRYFGQGLAEGEARGKAEMVLKLLALRYGTLPETIRAQIQAADSAQLDAIIERTMHAATLEEALAGPLGG